MFSKYHVSKDRWVDFYATMKYFGSELFYVLSYNMF